MFFNEFKYNLLATIRNRSFIFWLILFPMVLGTLFKAAFSDVYANDIKFSAIPAAVVAQKDDEAFREVIKAVSTGEDPLLKVTYADKEEAEELLKNGKVYGILTKGESLTLSVGANGIEETILKSFADRYLTQEKLIKDTAEKDPSKIPALIEVMQEETNSLKKIRITDGECDPLITYFFNLLAMVAVCSSVTGLNIVSNNQADQSPLAARKGCSPTPKLISTLAVLGSCWVVSSGCTAFSVSFLAFVLKINFGSRLGLVYLSTMIGGIMGTSMGFMIGSLVRGSEGRRNAAAMLISVGGNFLSGLMIADIKPAIMEKAPIVNALNPSAVVCDSLYYLNLDRDYDRYIGKLITMLAMTVIFTAVGFIFTRRKKYATL
ncbi:ABC transporter permease [Ruminococcus sp.]|uniref:ABC transporter permease n=1 Tax=Ruminococcus sp. TaxID=41978 RepID=UPI0025EBF9C7|nr:ABC transporter permease [Ruminococcus sp.]MBQ8965481.1 ABC transporter permease [Ruminococcus sp.]